MVNDVKGTMDEELILKGLAGEEELQEHKSLLSHITPSMHKLEIKPEKEDWNDLKFKTMA